MLLLFTAPVVELGFIQTEFTGSGSDIYAFSEFQCFIAEFGVYCLRAVLRVDAGFVMSNHLWLRVYSLSRVSTNGG